MGTAQIVIGCFISLIASVITVSGANRVAQLRRHSDVAKISSSTLRGALVGFNGTRQIAADDRLTVGGDGGDGGLTMIVHRESDASWQRSKRMSRSQPKSSSRSKVPRRRRRLNRGTRGVDERHLDSAEEVVEYPFTLLSKSVFLVTKIDLHSTFNIYFKMKTTHRYGLLFYSSKSLGNGQTQIFAVELWNGHVHYVYGTVADGGDIGRWTRKSPPSSSSFGTSGGSSPVAVTGAAVDGLRVLTDSSTRSLDDDRWHGVSVLRPSARVHYLQVDDAVSRDIVPHHHHQQQSPQQRQSASVQELSDSSSALVDDPRPDQLFIGGLPGPKYSALPDKIRSSDGFQGCLASIYLAGRSWSPCEDDEPVDVPDEMASFIRHGCHDSVVPHEECTSDHCPTNTGLCDSLGAASWTQCNTSGCGTSEREEDGMAYTFGRQGGLLAYSFPATRRPNTKFDRLSFGFTTIQRDTALVTITSSSYADFIHVELVAGHVIVTYNVGAHNLTIGETLKSLSDGLYHVIRFTRYGPNATLQVDSLPTQTRNPSGRQMVTFNHQAMIVVGGLAPPHNVGSTGNVKNIAKAFHGTIAGFTFNGLRLLELAAEGDDRVTITGDVQMEVKPIPRNNQQFLDVAPRSTTTNKNISFDLKDRLNNNPKIPGPEFFFPHLTPRLHRYTRPGHVDIDDLITTTSADVDSPNGRPCPRVHGPDAVKCDRSPTTVDAFIHPTAVTLGNITGVSMTTSTKTGPQSTVPSRSEAGMSTRRPTNPCTSDDPNKCVQAPPVVTPSTVATTMTRKSFTWLNDIRSTPTTVRGNLERNISSTSIITSKAFLSTPRLHVTAVSPVSHPPLSFVSTTTSSPPHTVYEISQDVRKNSPSLTFDASPSSIATVGFPVSRGVSNVDYPDAYGTDDVEPSLSYSSTAVRAVTVSRSLGLVLGLIACVTIAITIFAVLFIVYRYRAKSTPSRRASLVSVTSLGYSKAPTTDTSAPAAISANRVASPRPTTTHDCTAVAARWPATAASSEYFGCSGSDNIASRGELMGTSFVCATYGAAHGAFMTSSMTYGGCGGDGGCKTGQAKEWFV